MKHICLYFMLSVYSSLVLSQSQVSVVDNMVGSRIASKWNLNEYVWSHTHPLPKKGEKPILDFNGLDNWQCVSDEISISPNGDYFAYGILKGVDYLTKSIDTKVIQSLDGTNRIELLHAKAGFFSADSKQYVFSDQQGLYFLNLSTRERNCVKYVASYKVPNDVRKKWIAYLLKNQSLILLNLITGKEIRIDRTESYEFDNSGRWLACHLNNTNHDLVLVDLKNENERRFPYVTSYLFDQSGEVVILMTEKMINNQLNKALDHVVLSDKTGSKDELKRTIWSTSDSALKLYSFNIDGSGKQVVFMVNRTNWGDNSEIRKKTVANSIWYWNDRMSDAEMKIDDHSSGIDTNLFINGFPSFTDNNCYIQFTLQTRPEIFQQYANIPNVVKLDIWDYKDTILRSTQVKLIDEVKSFKAIFSIKHNKAFVLVKKFEKLKAIKGDYAVVGTLGKEIFGDRFWEKGYSIDSNWLVFLEDGSRHLLQTKSQGQNMWFSPSGKFLVYFDSDQRFNYFSYNLQTGQLLNISSKVPAWKFGHQDDGYYLGYQDWKKPIYPAGGLAGWLENNELLVYDVFDIWKLDPSGKMPAANLTNNYGRSHLIKFGLVDKSKFDNNEVILPNQILLRAFDIRSKNSGYYRMKLDSVSNPELLFMGPYLMQANEGTYVWDPGVIPLKAADNNVWIVKKQSETEPPNYYLTKDFKDFRSLTDVQSHKSYNWLTKEIHRFKQLDGKTNCGLLYKPENFDPSKKYPVIIIFYDRFTDNLHQFPSAQYNEHAVSFGKSPAWLVSHGYIVFTPDMYLNPLRYGPSAYNIIEGAAQYLKQLPYVDGKCIGGCAHSWSAKLGSYVFTHSSTLAAMVISEGFAFANPISLALSIDDTPGANDKSVLREMEKGFEYGNLWEHKNSWLDQTAIMNVDKAICPLLLLCSKQNENSRTNQTFQLFTALHRLQKSSWWLQYEKGGHVVVGYESRDFTIRFTQFFDHYLKGAPPPKWMTQGIRVKLKGIENGYELDPMGSCGKKCKICKKQ